MTAEDIDALIAAFAKRERTPRLEFAPGGAPGVEEALLAAGFEVQQRLPFMVVTAEELVGPAQLDDIEVQVLDTSATDEELSGVALAQHEAFEGTLTNRRTTPTSRTSWRACAPWWTRGGSPHWRAAPQEAASAGVPMAAGSGGPAIAGTTEIGGIGTRPAFRRRGAGAAVTAALSRHLLEVAGLDCVWLSPAGPDQERLYASIGYRSLGEMLFIWKP